MLWAPFLGQIQPPAMLLREQWGAAAPVLKLATQKRLRITIHHGGVPAKPDVPTATKIKNLQLWSQREDKLAGGKVKPQWADVPYHYWIGYDGVIAQARDDQTVGDTNTEYDPSGHVLVCVEGDFETTEPTRAQVRALFDLVYWLAERDHILTADIQTHKDYSKQTTCPGKSLYAQIDELRWQVLVRRRLGKSSR